ncbi:DUF3800 domain-containing protein [Shewanella oneidensis MR-1]|uniref:Phage P1-related protein in restrction modification operon RflA n=1 Tax=Shewanella oneidensis (strain ATCC 700550 / JCM 31522 / CIP 106686 / LMG 19005 / NCIMB 14063 / MR-1) TaxID=211586 RepID=Q8E9K8_SHEON|nr:DUF3800 domain-containing protein [Shewanella oneidensis]AAN57234.1 phage P1-related protein in restrction modification operon RflA [Shewanella oneidensis MR-1]MDX5998452.1 DUF3800 domain-containing protein [Shewanella oneidensis]MEE2030181.1 hypothetical protein [Shewanella oneidensis]QKG94597.1 DUF3800 domain-containing protein [Shewanella oneidensis MR-1]
MSEIYNVYCDESCHLEHDGQQAMVLGGVWCPESKRQEISQRIREIKVKHGLGKDFEIKWTKVSKSKLDFYMDIIDYFFDDDDFHFRGLIVPDKTKLNHDAWEQTHDEWYYKMYFNMLKVIFDPQAKYRVYLDIKDTLGADKIKKLHDVLCNNSYDYSRQVIERVQQVHSHESEQLQVADLLIGALSYLHRGLDTNVAKLKLIERIKQRSRYRLTCNTLLREAKFNLLIWNGGAL